MKNTYAQCIEKYNTLLTNYNCRLRVVSFEKDTLILNNQLTLIGIEVRKFRQRLTVSPRMGPYLDTIYASENQVVRDNILQEIKANHASIANKKYWKELSPDLKAPKIKHMQRICKLADHSNEPYYERWNTGKTKLTDERLKKNSQDRMGSGNPMYGTRMSEEKKSKKSMLIKGRIASGEWTPHVHNSRTHWECSFNGKKFRSSWETMYAALHPTELYEAVRIKYQYNGIDHIYMVDFVNHDTKMLTEIKPDEHKTNDKVMQKEQAAIEWCKTDGYTYRILTQQYFVDQFNNIPFDDIIIPNLRQKIAKIKHEANKANRNSKT